MSVDNGSSKIGVDDRGVRSLFLQFSGFADDFLQAVKGFGRHKRRVAPRIDILVALYGTGERRNIGIREGFLHCLGNFGGGVRFDPLLTAIDRPRESHHRVFVLAQVFF